MKTDRDKDSQTSRHESMRRDFYKTAESFRHWLAKRLNVGARATVILARSSARTHRFAKLIINRRHDIRGADTLGFLALYFGHKFVSAQTRRLAGERVYRQPLRSVRNTTYKAVTELFMSFNVSHLVQNLQIFLNHVRTGQIVASTERMNFESERTPTFIDRRELSQTMEFRQTIWLPGEAPLGSPSPRETTNNSLETRMRDRLETRMRDRLETRMSDRLEGRTLDRLEARMSDRFERRYPVWFETRLLDPTFILTNRQRSDRERTLIRERITSTTDWPLPSVLNRALVSMTQIRNAEAKSPPPQFGLGADAAPWLRKIVSERRPSTPPPPGRESVTTMLMSQHRSWAELPFLFARRLGFERVKGVNSASDSPANLGALNPRTALGTPMKEFTFPGRPWQFGKNVCERFTVMSAASEEARQLRLASELVGLRKDRTSPAPPLRFVFAQPPRQLIAEEPAIKKVETREIVELVKKEVQQTMAREAPLASLTGEDYAEISDRVYSSLARRLTVERERLGLR